MTCFSVGDDPIPPTVFGTRSKPPSALGLLIRGVGVAFICPARAKVLAAAARPSACRDVTAAVAAARAHKLEAWPTCLVSAWSSLFRGVRLWIGLCKQLPGGVVQTLRRKAQNVHCVSPTNRWSNGAIES